MAALRGVMIRRELASKFERLIEGAKVQELNNKTKNIKDNNVLHFSESTYGTN